MTIDELRNAHLARPFRPFTLELADGQKVPVPHPEFMMSAPRSRSIGVVTPQRTHKIIDLLMVVAIDFRRNGQPRRRGNGRLRGRE